MSPRRRWIVRGLVLGIVLALGALLMPQPALDGAATTAGLGHLLPFAAPPLGMKARAAIAVPAIIAGLLLGWIGGLLFGRGEAEDEEEIDAAPPAAATSLRDRGWQPFPVPEPERPAAGLATDPGAGAFEHDREPAEAAPAGPARREPAPIDAAAEARPEPIAEAPVAATDAPVAFHPAPAGPVALVPGRGAPEPRLMPEPVPPIDPARLERIEAALDALARRAPLESVTRFDSLDARLSELSQQVAEVASLARAALRTPTAPATSAPVPLEPAAPAVRAPLPPPGDPDRRRAVAEAARALRARLDGAGMAG